MARSPSSCCALLAAVGLAVGLGLVDGLATKPNVLFIVIDDLGFDGECEGKQHTLLLSRPGAPPQQWRANGVVSCSTTLRGYHAPAFSGKLGACCCGGKTL